MDKNLRWSVFSQCDGQAVRELSQYGNREPQTVVRLKAKKTVSPDVPERPNYPELPSESCCCKRKSPRRV